MCTHDLCSQKYHIFLIIFTAVKTHCVLHGRVFVMQDYFTHRDEPIDRWGETGVPRENHLTIYF